MAALFQYLADRLRHLTTQLKWRLANGNGAATYIIGIEDDGTPTGIPEEQLSMSLAVLRRMADSLGAALQQAENFRGTNPHSKIARVHVMQGLPAAPSKPEVRLALLGAQACGKSTLCGVLANGDMDDGDGQARYFVFRHEHEIDDGRTSSVSCQLVGFDEQGKLLNAAAESIGSDVTPAEIAERSSRLLSILDLAGHHKYLKTTVVGMMGHLPDVALLLVDATVGVQRMTREHLAIAMALGIPVTVVLNKIDLVSSAAARAKVVESVRALFRAAGSRHRVRLIKDTAAAAEAASMLGVPKKAASAHGPDGSVLIHEVPLLLCSQVTAEGLPVLVHFLSCLTPSRNNAHFQALPASLQVVDCFDVSGVGTVAAGTVFSGRIQAGQQLALGPDGLGKFQAVTVKSIHCNRTPVSSVRAGQSAAVALEASGSQLSRASVRKGMVLLEPSTANAAAAVREFEATITILRHGSPITPRSHLTVFSGSFKQSAEFVWMRKTKLQAGDVCTVRLRLQHRPEFMQVSQPVLLTARPAVAIGTVTRVGSSREAAPRRRGHLPRSGSFDVDSMVATGHSHERMPGAADTPLQSAVASGSGGSATPAGHQVQPHNLAAHSPHNTTADAPSIISILSEPAAKDVAAPLQFG